MNRIIRLIFNENIIKKCYLWIRKQCKNAQFMIEKSTFAAERIKKGLNALQQMWTQQTRIQTAPNSCVWNISMV